MPLRGGVQRTGRRCDAVYPYGSQRSRRVPSNQLFRPISDRQNAGSNLAHSSHWLTSAFLVSIVTTRIRLTTHFSKEFAEECFTAKKKGTPGSAGGSWITMSEWSTETSMSPHSASTTSHASHHSAHSHHAHAHAALAPLAGCGFFELVFVIGVDVPADFVHDVVGLGMGGY
jgi:hypothetical protein